MNLDFLTRSLRGTLLRLQPASTDGQLLRRFVAEQDQAAFEELVRRHGPMVLQVCQRVLRHLQDAEDAFQATFVVLARKAPGLVGMESVGGWLHGVAWRVAMNARKLRGRRPIVTATPSAGSVPSDPPAARLLDADENGLLDEELARLPEQYRTPIVLCHLQGKSTEEAAGQLGWPCGTVKTRLSRGRKLLRERLTRRGVTLGVAGVAGLMGAQPTAAVAAGLLRATVQGAVRLAAGAQTAPGLISAPALELAASLADSAGRKVFWAIALVVLGGTGLALALSVADNRRQPAVAVQSAGSATIQMPRGVPMVRRAFFSPDNRLLALGDAAGGVTLFEVEWGTDRLHLNKRPFRPSLPCCAMAFRPQGRTLAVGRPDGTVLLLDPVRGEGSATLRTVHPGMVVELAFSPDGQALAALVERGGLTTWDLRTLAAPGQARLPDQPDPASSLRMHLPNGVQSQVHLPHHVGGAYLALTALGELFVIDSSYRLRSWDAATGTEKKLSFPPLPPSSQPEPVAGRRTGFTVAPTPDGRFVIVAANDGAVYRWDRSVDRLEHLFTLDAEEQRDGLSFLAGPTGDSVSCLIGRTNRLVIWDIVRRCLLAEVVRPPGATIVCRAYSPDGTKFYWSGLAEPVRPGMTTVDSVGGIIDLDVKRRQIDSRQDN